jgi:hypothetical protein
MLGSRFRVSGFRVSELRAPGFRIENLGLRVWGLGFSILGLGLVVHSFR